MKKLLAVCSLLLLAVGLSYAATPKDQSPNQWTNFMHGNAIIASTFSVTGTPFWSVTAPGTSQGVSCQTCLTKILLQLSNSASTYILEGSTALGVNATTDYIILGQGLGAAGTYNTLVLPEDHLGPLCFQNGNTVFFNEPVSTFSVVDVEGFTDCGGSRN